MEPTSPDAADVLPLFCARCACELHPGSGDFFEVTIEAKADPSPPDLGSPEPAEVLQARLKKLCEELRDVSEREAMDQVYRHLVIQLCSVCFRSWIENPAS